MTFREYLNESTGTRGRYLKRVSSSIYSAFFPVIMKVLQEKKEGTFTFSNAPENYFVNFFTMGKARAIATMLMPMAAAAGMALTKRPDVALAAGFAGPALLNYVSRLFKYHSSYKVQTPNVEVDGKKIKIGPVSINLVISSKYKDQPRELESGAGGYHNAGGVMGTKLTISLLASPETPISQIQQNLIDVINHEVTHKYQKNTGDESPGVDSSDYTKYRQDDQEIEAWYQEKRQLAKRTGKLVGNLLYADLWKTGMRGTQLVETMRKYIHHAMKYYPNDVFYHDKRYGNLKPTSQ